MTIGEEMLQFRAKCRISQVELSRLLKVSVMTIYRTENNITTPHKNIALAISRELKKLDEEMEKQK